MPVVTCFHAYHRVILFYDNKTTDRRPLYDPRFQIEGLIPPLYDLHQMVGIETEEPRFSIIMDYLRNKKDHV